ncbi:hypothetical protein Dda_2759 [Drechslerella dactyloides]|uniref:Uncharacterized protein n=1 Tax=Drechslerella dactyloides TaxID=74499 RepID=A0AAD6J2E0_DREDA|nr:hypothetical protein Dda_2759 [Drechslerella dactyloides]
MLEYAKADVRPRYLAARPPPSTPVIITVTAPCFPIAASPDPPYRSPPFPGLSCDPPGSRRDDMTRRPVLLTAITTARAIRSSKQPADQ